MTTTFFPPHVGGIEYHVLNLSKHLVERGHKITVLTCFPHESVSFRRYDGIDVTRVKAFFPLGWPFSSMSSMGVPIDAGKKVSELVREKDIDIVHAHGHHYPLTWSSLATASRLKLPSVLTLHGLYALDPWKIASRAMEEAFNLTIFRDMLKHTTAVIGLTKTIADYAKKYVTSGETYVIPNGVNIGDFLGAGNHRKLYREKYQIPEKMVVLFCGRFTQVKGVLELAEAARILAQTSEDVFFLFVGDGPLYKRLDRTLRSEELSYRITGWVPYSKVHELYLASDIYVLPSKWEALPLTIMEAMSSRLYIVATPVGGVPDILADYPWKTYIDNPSPYAIAEALRRAISSAKTRVDADSGLYVDLIRRFDWSNIAKETEKVYLDAERCVSTV